MIIGEYAQFWKLLSEHHTQLSQLKKTCDNILQYKKSIKNLFSELEQIIKLNVELYQLSYYYHNHIIFEPMEARLYDKKITNLKQQISVEFRKENYLYPLDKNAFVISASFQAENIGHVIWASRNAKEILEIDEKLLRSLHINSIMPKVISNVHDDFLLQYLKVARSNLVNNYKDLWALTYKKKLLSMKMCVKLYFEDNGLHLISFIRQTTDKTSIIINEFGEVDSYGENFFKMAGLEYDFCFTYSNISIFAFMPQMIIQFLNFFYGLENFKIQDFPYSCLDDTFFIVFKDMNPKILDLSKILKNAKDNKEVYAMKLYKFLNSLEFETIEKVYRVRLKSNHFVYRKAETCVKFWDLKFVDFIDVTDKFTIDHFNQQKCFLEKIKFDESLKVSIEKYNNRLMENQMDHPSQQNLDDIMPNSQQIHGTSREEGGVSDRRRHRSRTNGYEKVDEDETESFLHMKSPQGLEVDNDEESRRDRRASHRKTATFLTKQEKAHSADKSNELEIHKATAINIIRKLFTKNFNPVKDKEVPSGTRKKWIDSINNYIQKRNSIISTIVEYHIGNLTRKSAAGF